MPDGSTNFTVVPASGDAARDASPAHILRREQVAGRSGSRSAGKNELVSRKARPFVGLKHAVAESVLLGQSEIGRNVGWH